MIEQLNTNTSEAAALQALPANPFEISPPAPLPASRSSEQTFTSAESGAARPGNLLFDIGAEAGSNKSATVLDFTPPYLQGEVKVSVPASFDGALPGLGISQGTDLFLPDVQLGGKTESSLPANSRIARAAERNAGTMPWMDTKYTPQVQNGRLAGAAAVSMVLQDLGYKYADSANVGKLSSQLEKQGWTKIPLDQAQPGDIIYGGRVGKDWRAGGGNAHIGIVGQDGKVWHNVSSTGNWQADSQDSSFPPAKYGNQIWVLRPPQTDVPPAPVPDRAVRPNNPADRTIGPRPGHYNPEPRPGIDPGPRPGDDPLPRPEDRPEDGDQSIKARAKRILDASKRSVDKRLWAMGDFANSVKGGRLGCAAAVSEVLKMSGFSYANSAGVGNMVDILKRHGWTQVELKDARPGDVVYGGKPGTRWWEGGGNAHIGVVGEDGQVFHNSSGRRRWVQDDLTAVFNTKRFGQQRWALRPPQSR